ncbi:MAG: lipid-binding SYLF domain-containing protein [Alphaproteobacteria bacterium]|nr:lipid-binding SYLF domain-containing protein [Alphaproteobacteria bacterium]
MIKFRSGLLAILFLAISGASIQVQAASYSEQQELIERAKVTFQKLMASPDFSNLPGYVRQAKAIMIFPSLVKGGFGLGAEGGTGVMLAKDAQKGWSDPAFYTIASGSLGIQVGGQVSEVVLTIMTEKAFNTILDDNFKFGGDVSVAAGPMGVGMGTGLTSNFDADIYSFAKVVGLFGGASLQGSSLMKRDTLNSDFYGPNATPEAILIQRKFSNPLSQPLKNVLASY